MGQKVLGIPLIFSYFIQSTYSWLTGREGVACCRIFHHRSEPNPTFNPNLNQILATAFHHISDVQIKEQLPAFF